MWPTIISSSYCDLWPQSQSHSNVTFDLNHRVITKWPYVDHNGIIPRTFPSHVRRWPRYDITGSSLSPVSNGQPAIEHRSPAKYTIWPHLTPRTFFSHHDNAGVYDTGYTTLRQFTTLSTRGRMEGFQPLMSQTPLDSIRRWRSYWKQDGG